MLGILCVLLPLGGAGGIPGEGLLRNTRSKRKFGFSHGGGALSLRGLDNETGCYKFWHSERMASGRTRWRLESNSEGGQIYGRF